MASISSTPLARRKKQTVYGKSSSKPFSPAGTGIFEDDEPAWVAVTREPKKYNTTIPARPSKAVKPQPPVQPERPAKRPGALPKAKKSPPRVRDTYDVPSDDEDAEMFTQVRLPQKKRIQSRLLDEPKEEAVQLAPWEKKAAKKSNENNNTATRSSRSKAAAGSAAEKPNGIQREGSGSGKVLSGRMQDAPKEIVAEEGPRMTAMQRLAARRRQAEGKDPASIAEKEDIVKDPHKRSAVKADTTEHTQSKRRRMTPQPSSPHVNTPDVDNAPVGTPVDAVSQPALEDGCDIFDVPSEDEPLQPKKPVVRATTKVRQRRPGAGLLRRVTPQKGVSAPSRLEDMVASEDDHTTPAAEYDSPMRSETPQTALRDSAKETPSTPISEHSSCSHGQKAGTLTPKQTQLWADLLEPTVTPHTGMMKLSIKGDTVQRKPTRGAPAILQRSSSDVPVKRTRITDRLKASAPNSSDDESQDEEDVPIRSVPALKPAVSNASTSQESNSLSHVDRSQERPAKPTTSGSLITYSQQRSILADDDLESALMLDISMQTPERPAASSRRVGRPAMASRSTSHVDVDLEDAPTAGLRTIHELRAGGRNARIRGEIEDLIGEIADRASTARSRRRGALLDLTTKLLDKAFAEQIVSHGFDNALLNQCRTPSDPAADFLLATSLLLLLQSEPPKHTLVYFGEVLPHICKLLAEPTDIAKVIKERRSNISRSAQGDVLAISDKLKNFQGLWSDAQPTHMSSRLVALKITEIVVSKLRETGDKSELVERETLTLLVPKDTLPVLQSDTYKAFEANLIISILEALKTLTPAGSWPETCISLVAALPATFAMHWQVPAGTKWLAYRLCANITNESSVVRTAFIEQDAVRHLMAEIVTGLEHMHNPPIAADGSESDPARDFDILVLATGTLINLTEHSAVAQQHAIHATAMPSLTSIVNAFLEGQKRAEEAESVEQSAANVAYGYLAIMLANLCQDSGARQTIRSLLPGGTLDVLVAAVDEFVQHHQRVDGMESDGLDSERNNLTERLLGVLVKLQAGEGEGMEGVQT
ncbi:hypothetical protein MBLNU13_g05818t1 [Cladosporium sp. NU13]